MGVILFAVSLALLGPPQLSAQATYQLTINSSPIEGGQVTGAGFYPPGADASVTISSSPGWAINSVDVQPDEADDIFLRWLLHTMSACVGPLTNLTGGVHMDTDRVLDVTFGRIPMTPQLTAPGATAWPGQSTSATTPTFIWEPLTGTEAYVLFISRRQPDGSWQVIFNSCESGFPISGTSTAFSLPSGYLEVGGYYSWRMMRYTVARGARESLLNSAPLYFNVVAPQSGALVIDDAALQPTGIVRKRLGPDGRIHDRRQRAGWRTHAGSHDQYRR